MQYDAAFSPAFHAWGELLIGAAWIAVLGAAVYVVLGRAVGRHA